MPTTDQTFWPSADAPLGWGTDVRPLTENNNIGGAEDNTKADFGTDTSQREIVLDPFNTSTLADNDTNRKAYGWAIAKTLMESTATAKRRILAGTWTFEGNMFATSAQTGAGNSHTRVTVYVYRVAADNTRTQLFTASSANITVLLTTTQWSFTTSQSEIILEADETIQIGFTLRSVGVAVTGQIITFRLGNNAAVGVNDDKVTVPTPGIRTRFPRTATAAAVAAATVVRKKRTTLSQRAQAVATVVRKKRTTLSQRARGVPTLTRKKATTLTATARGLPTLVRSKRTTLTAAAAGAASLTRKTAKTLSQRAAAAASLDRRLTLFRTLTAAAAGAATLTRKKATTLTAAAVGAATLTRKTAKTLTAAAAAAASLTRKVGKPLTAAAVGAAELDKLARKTLTAAAVGAATLVKQLRLRRTLETVARGVARGLANLPFERIPGGASVIETVKKFFPVFDD